MSDENEVYCICRSSDASRFMIACDHCEEWYHGDCIKVTEREAKYIKHYYCRMCIQKNPKLTVVYKSKHKDSQDHREHRGKDRDRDRDRNRDRDRERHRQEKHKKHHKHKKDHKDRHKDRDRERDHDRDRERDRDRDREKERERHKEKKREEEKKKEEKDTPKTAKIESESQSDDSSIGKPSKVKDSGLRRLSTLSDDKPDPVSLLKRKSSLDDSVTSSPKRQKIENKKQKNVLMERNLSDDDSDDDFDASKAEKSPDSTSGLSEDWKPVAPKPAKTKRDARGAKTVKKSGTKRTRRRGREVSSSDDDTGDTKVDLTPRQCFGHKCVYQARPGSNYCSDNCGINLASLRIMQTLPDRIREWNLTPCQAEEKNRKELEKIRSKQEVAKARLAQLNNEFRELEDLIAKGKSQTIDREKEDEEDEGESAEVYVHCVTCGSDVQTRTAIRHMERCYNKMESQTSFASKFKTQINDERMFCDYYNRKDQTYCKRLQVLCPEHNQDAKYLSEGEVCGYPIQKEVFGKPYEFCRLSKRRCQPHSFWEKFRRAEIDMDRVRQWMKLDELLDQERIVKSLMSSRAGVLGLLLHSTFNHEMDDRFQAQRAAAAQKAAQMRKIQQQQRQTQSQVGQVATPQNPSPVKH